MAARTLTQRELNRALLARQLLLERAKTPIPKALERMAGVQAQYAPAMYIGLWSRLAGFEREQLTRALERGSIVQGTLMRTTIHLVSKGDYWPFAVALRGRRSERARVYKHPEREFRRAAARIRKFLTDGPRTATEIADALGSEVWRPGVGLWVELVRVPPSGTWERRRADLYALAEDWVGPENASEGEGVEHLARRYLQGFGPAAAKDIANWIGLKPTVIRPALERLDLRRFQDEHGKELLDLPRAPLPDSETPAPPRFLPVWDATLLVHARRTGVLPEQYRPRVFNVKTPHSVNTFLVDGQVAGTWRCEKGRIELEPFGRLAKQARAELNEEAERLAAFHA
ncbi:MAG TPA: winged helix DNA-binding domain-containing protein [Gaiellaceae bacterium]|nr:winged helix DNA-binding domain-containing protein [Gaiellaceae bacterium]